MTDFSEIENELRKLRPAQPSHEIWTRIEQGLADPEISGQKVIRPNRFRVSWVALGFGVAAAAVLLVLVRVSTDRRPERSETIAQNSAAAEAGSASSDEFVPAGATQIVYNTRDEGLHFADDSGEPMRRLRYQTHEMLQWHNPVTGASLRVSYPSEEIVLIPISGQ